jgi:hypothetical protein
LAAPCKAVVGKPNPTSGIFSSNKGGTLPNYAKY